MVCCQLFVLSHLLSVNVVVGILSVEYYHRGVVSDILSLKYFQLFDVFVVLSVVHFQ